MKMSLTNNDGNILVTGAGGHIGLEVCRLLKASRLPVLGIDLNEDKGRDIRKCDLRSNGQLSALFQNHRIRAVIHLAGILPSAFRADPMKGADVNLIGSLELIRHSQAARVKRFVFGSSMSIYGALHRRPVTEDDAATPNDVYGASKRAIELVGETLAQNGAFEFVALRIARVIGPGIRTTSSPWRSQVFEAVAHSDPINIPFSPEALLSLVHVEDVARMLVTLVQAPKVDSFSYNSPAEIWQTKELKELVEGLRGVHVQLGPEATAGGPVCEGSRFAKEFKFQLCGLRERFQAVAGT